MAIGYEVELTPLQILAFYNAVANDGEMIKPQFVSEIREGNETVHQFEKVVLNEKICSDVTLEKVKICLEGVVKEGTGRMLQSANFSIAGKTGTAKIVNSNQGYGDDYQASFVGYFPADNPKYSCIVTIAGPTKQIYGAQVSGTVFTAIADKVYSSSMMYHENYNITNAPIQTLPKVKNGSAAETNLVLSKMKLKYRDASEGGDWAVATEGNGQISLTQRTIHANKVPNVKGMPLNDAVYLLENSGLRVKVTGHGRVVKQSQDPGTELVKGTLITLELK
jgi:cell division protein FtsI (penicillin-binding protein 3)